MDGKSFNKRYFTHASVVEQYEIGVVSNVINRGNTWMCPCFDPTTVDRLWAKDRDDFFPHEKIKLNNQIPNKERNFQKKKKSGGEHS